MIEFKGVYGMKCLLVLLILSIGVFAQDVDTAPAEETATEETTTEESTSVVQGFDTVHGSTANISPFFRVGAGLGLQIHQGGTWIRDGAQTHWHGGEWEGFNAGVTNLSMGVLVRSVDCAFTLDNTTAWFNTQGFWGDDPLAASSVTAIMATWYPSEAWSVGGGFGLFLLGTPFNEYGTLSGPAGMTSFGRRIAEDVFVEGKLFVGMIKQDHSEISDTGLVIGANIVVNADMIF
jgi:hypothetical protein